MIRFFWLMAIAVCSAANAGALDPPVQDQKLYDAAHLFIAKLNVSVTPCAPPTSPRYVACYARLRNHAHVAYREFIQATSDPKVRDDARRVYAAWLALIDGAAEARALDQHTLDEAEGLLQADIE